MKRIVLASAAMLALTVCAQEQRPNIIFILADDLGYGDISSFNPESKISTPNIDRLARDGVRFTNAHAASALSTPSRYALLTGRYPWRTSLKQGGLDGDSPALIAPERETMAEMLSARGYRTACVGKWHLGMDWKRRETDGGKSELDFDSPIKNGPTERGFDYFFGIPASLDIAPYVYVENDRVTAPPDRTIAKQNKEPLLLMHGGPAGADFEPGECLPNLFRHAIEYVDGRKSGEEPFFLYLPLSAPHTPVLPAPEYRGKTGIGDYGDFVVMIDDLIGDLVEALERNGQLDDTMIVFTSDNGCAGYIHVGEMERKGHRPSYIYRGYKSDIYEGGHRVPLIVSWKGRLCGEERDDLVSLIDFYATFAQMTGHELRGDEAVDSYSFWPLIAGLGSGLRKDLICEAGEGYLSLLRSDGLKLIFYGGSGGWSRPTTRQLKEAEYPPMQLFDLSEDPAEKRNLISEPAFADEVVRMKSDAARYISEGRSTPGEPDRNDTDIWRQARIIMETALR